MVAAALLAEYERIRNPFVENQQRGPHGEDGLRVNHFDLFPSKEALRYRVNAAREFLRRIEVKS